MCYFDLVHIESVYQPGKARVFDFNEAFEGKYEINDTDIQTTGAYLKLTNFSGQKIGKLDYVNPYYIRDMLLENFYMKLYKAKLAGRQIVINVTKTINGKDVRTSLNDSNIPNFEYKDLPLKLDADQILNQVNYIFKKAVAGVINERVPKIQKANKERKVLLENAFPHLSGYFDTSEIGYSSQADILKKAQDKYFKEQRDILGAKELSEEQYEKSINLSARALAEYILFRQNVINRMRTFNGKEIEADLHNLLVPKGSEFKGGDIIEDLYRNNVWVLDDKFMSYCSILSEAEMSKVIDVLTEGEINDKDDDRPDITIFFLEILK